MQRSFPRLLITVWFFPRIADARFANASVRKNLKPLYEHERREVFQSAWLPSMLTIGLPLAYLSQAAFGWGGWWSTFILIISFLVYSAISLLIVHLTTKCLIWTIDIAVPLIIPALLILGVFGWKPASTTYFVTSPVVVVGTVICWLFVFHGITFMVFLDRYRAIQSRSEIDAPKEKRLGFLPKVGPLRVLRRHNLLIFAGLAVWAWVHYVPRQPLWISVNDGRLSGPVDTSGPTQRASLAETFEIFSKDLPKFENRKPFVLVTAAGGGIRAAYWTAAVLTELQKNESSFHRRVFAISAVSGGSLGAATYKALTARGASNCGKRAGYRECATGFLAGDFVGPNVLAAISGEIIQVFARGWLPLLERDEALQLAWSNQWSHSVGNGNPSFSGDFDELFKEHPTPALLLNGTSMLTGRRTITSNLDVSLLSSGVSEPRKGCASLPGTINPAQYLKLSASAAVLTSARFPYVTPAGLLPLVAANANPNNPKPQCWDEIVDGGYVDNEGIITMREVLNRLVEAMPHEKHQDPVQIFKETYRVIVLRLSSQASPVDDSGDNLPPNRDHLGQLFIALTNQRNATGRDLVNDFSGYVSKLGGCLIELNALDDDAPLGWSLSEKSRNRLNAWLDGPKGPNWKSLYSDKSDGNARLLALAKKVKMAARLQRIQDLLNGKAASCARPLFRRSWGRSGHQSANASGRD